MRIKHFWVEEDIYKLITYAQRYTQLDRIRPKIHEIIRRIERVIIALETLNQSSLVKEAHVLSKKILKHLNNAKQADSLLMIRTTLERVKDIV